MRRGPPIFDDRTEAGRRLAAVLPQLERPIVLGLPRGGVPVAAAVAAELGTTFDAFMVRKLGVPWQPELALGAVATGGVRVLNDDVIRETGVQPAVVEEVTRREAAELALRERRFRGDRPPPALAGRNVVIVDDGLATGATMRAAVAAAAVEGPSRVLAAAPVAPRDAAREFARAGVELVTVATPHPFVAVGVWYRDFAAVSDEEVVRLLADA